MLLIPIKTRIEYKKMDEKEKKVLYLVLSILAGIPLFGYGLFIIIYMTIVGNFFMFYRYFGYMILAILLILSAIFSLKPRKTSPGRRQLGIASTVSGTILILLPTVGIIVAFTSIIGDVFSIAYVFTLILSDVIFFIPGIVLSIHGFFLIQGNGKPKTKQE